MQTLISTTSAEELHAAGWPEDRAFFASHPTVTYRIRPCIGAERHLYATDHVLVIALPMPVRARVPLAGTETPEEIAVFVADIVGHVWQQQHGREVRA
ncbi:hypothetical protein [Elioraea rosea]|uniref:hypothetical protein n=1 Tax=Elioraea rosea TaxID=2492390 RepID=UPI0011824038|nr:hypothetical protein [Elioraea rosea]